MRVDEREGREGHNDTHTYGQIDLSRDIDTRFNIPLILVKANQVFW